MTTQALPTFDRAATLYVTQFVIDTSGPDDREVISTNEFDIMCKWEPPRARDVSDSNRRLDRLDSIFIIRYMDILQEDVELAITVEGVEWEVEAPPEFPDRGRTARLRCFRTT